MQLDDRTALVIGASRGLGNAIVRALAAQRATVWAVARNSEQLDILKREVPSVQTLAADATDPQLAPQILRDIRPDILVLSLGATPTMAPVHQQSWEQFAGVWETDVKASFLFGRETLLQPLAPGSVVVIMSSGAAIGGSPLSGGYSGAKRTQWFLAQFLQRESNALNLGIRFVALLPQQIINTTQLGHTAAAAYAAQQGISEQAFAEGFGVALTPEGVGQGVVALLTDQAYRDGIAYGINGQGLTVLE
jgi:NAD(P)-dependent dehydrogenase (short-subunit alcohol dehydrogenase family)